MNYKNLHKQEVLKLFEKELENLIQNNPYEISDLYKMIKNFKIRLKKKQKSTKQPETLIKQAFCAVQK